MAHIGTSGWHYAHWKGVFYPDDLPDGRRLEYYKERLHTVEINNSFYQMPKKKTFQDWKATVPDDFIFSVKASRYITHMKKLKDPEGPVANFMDPAETLAGNLGPILFQLPPRWKVNPERLEAFLGSLPGGHRFAFEFRDPSWFNDRILELLAKAGAAFCIYDIEGRQSPKEITADFVYIRLHGPGEAYRGSYDIKTLSGWAGAISAWEGSGKETYCYFDNDEKGYAVENALSLQEMAG